MRLFPIFKELDKILAKSKFIICSGVYGRIGREVFKVGIEDGITMVFFPEIQNTLDTNLITMLIFIESGYNIKNMLILNSIDGVISITRVRNTE